MTDDYTNWCAPSFRQDIAQKINEAVMSLDVDSSRKSVEMEAHAFRNAKNKYEYLTLVVRLVLRYRAKSGYHACDSGMPDPIIALRNMTSVGLQNPEMMGMTEKIMDNNVDWRSISFRQINIQNLNKAILSTGTSSFRNAIEMEAFTFQRAKTKGEYLGFVTWLILHVREMTYKNRQNIGNVNFTGIPGMSDLVNDLQNMTLVGTPIDPAPGENAALWPTNYPDATDESAKYGSWPNN